MDEPSAGYERVAATLEKAQIAFDTVRTEAASSAEESASFQGVELAQLLKTIVVRKGPDDHVFVLVPADREIDWKKLRRQLGVSRASLPAREDAERITGYRVGTITPFGAATDLPVIVDALALQHDVVALGGGERGVNVHVAPGDLVQRIGATAADVTSPSERR